MASDEERFFDLVRANRSIAVLLERLPGLGLPHCYLTGGCLSQTVWNLDHGAPPEAGIRDYDLFYYDAGDISWQAEDVRVRRVDALFRDLNAPVDVKNQARVHLWYEERFGARIPPMPSSRAGIDNFLFSGMSLGVEIGTGALYAPNGLDDLFAGILRPNPDNLTPGLWRDKAEDYRRRWPKLKLVEG